MTPQTEIRRDTRTRLLDAAEELFAEHGFAAASVRGITTRAEADLGAVRYHFGSKQALYEAVLKRRIVPLCEERLRRLDQLEREAAGTAISLEILLRAFAAPAHELVSHREHGQAWMKLIARTRVEPAEYFEPLRAPFKRLNERYLAALARTLPDLEADDLAYRFYFFYGTEVNTLIDPKTLSFIQASLPGIRDEPQLVLDRLIEFTAAGFRARAQQASRASHAVRPKHDAPPEIEA